MKYEPEADRALAEARAENKKRLEKAAPELFTACEFTLKQAGLSVNSPSFKKLEQAITNAGGTI